MPPSRARAVLVHGALKVLGVIPGARAFVDNLGMKPTMTYPRGLFVPGKSALTRGAWFPQTLVRKGNGKVALSDDLLGNGFSLVGLGTDPSLWLGASTAAAWARLGGTLVAVDAKPKPGSAAVGAERLDSRLGSSSGPRPWCVVLRPDRTILNDGSAVEADRSVREALRLLGAPG
jgi:3-(3-hydroxy-phenyl)propionate hydroxylase